MSSMGLSNALIELDISYCGFLKYIPLWAHMDDFFFSIANDTLHGIKYVFKKTNWCADALFVPSFLLNTWWTKEKEREKFGEREVGSQKNFIVAPFL